MSEITCGRSSDLLPDTGTFPTACLADNQWLTIASPMMELTAAGLCRTLTCFPLGP